MSWQRNKTPVRNGASHLSLYFLNRAVIKRDLAIVERLIAIGTEVNAHFQGRTPLQYASELGDCEIVGALLAAGADVNAPDLLSGRTALHYSAETQKSEITNFLQKKPPKPPGCCLTQGRP